MISEWGFFLIKMLYFCSFQKYVFINSVFFFVEKKNLQFLCFFQIFSENFYFGIVQNSLEGVERIFRKQLRKSKKKLRINRFLGKTLISTEISVCKRRRFHFRCGHSEKRRRCWSVYKIQKR